MLFNSNIEVHGRRIMLVPYEEKFVSRYHEWMQSVELLEATGSEPLTLEEEYEMQRTWRNDDDKLTFIIVDKARMKDGEEAAMIGDTNLFINEDGYAEVMIMIAEKESRRLGFGQEALILLLRYAIESLGIEKFLAKINMKNIASSSLFKKVGFTLDSFSEIFSEETYKKSIDDNWTGWIVHCSPEYKIRDRPMPVS